MNKKTLKICLICALVISLGAAFLFFFSSKSTLRVKGKNLRVCINGIDTNEINIVLKGKIPDECETIVESSKVFDSFDSSGELLVPKYTDLTEINIIKQSKRRLELTSGALKIGDGSITVSFIKDDAVQAKVVIYVSIDDNGNFTDFIVSFFEDPEVENILIADTFDAQTRQIDDGLMITIKSDPTIWYFNTFDQDIVSDSSIDEITYDDGSFAFVVSICVRSEGEFSIPVSGVMNNKQLILNFKSFKMNSKDFTLKLLGATYEEKQ